MPSLTVTQQIDASREVVFDKLTDYSSAADTYSAITKMELLTEGEVGAGTRFRETRVMFGKEATEEMTIEELERPSRLLLTAASHGCSYRSTYHLAEKDGGTELSLTFEGRGVSFMGKLMSALMGWMMKGACRKAMSKDFADLKAAVEVSGATS
jgi:uncharacterized protein YndB with AHSA1/START domain